MTNDKDDLADLTALGSGKKPKPIKKLETFPNHSIGRYYVVRLVTKEFTCICPKTGQPDFATITICYVPDTKIVESKSLKLYLWSYRNEGVFHEHLANIILDDLVKALDPHYCVVKGAFDIRGGIGIDVIAEHVKTAAAKEEWAKTFPK
jgi:7-cyano-7-deazaguanine reductase